VGATTRVNDTPTVSECLVRPSISADIPAITAIYSKFVTASTATFEIVAPDESEMFRRWRAVLDRNLPFLVAELEVFVMRRNSVLAKVIATRSKIQFTCARIASATGSARCSWLN
jgi:hypothetical protein